MPGTRPVNVPKRSPNSAGVAVINNGGFWFLWLDLLIFRRFCGF